MPKGLGSCSRLTTLDVVAPMDLDLVIENAGLLAAIESVKATLEVLDISGWAPAFNGVLELISEIPRLHTLVAQRNELTAVPALPATLRSLDISGANEFTDVPVQLESLTQLTYLALSSKPASASFQIRCPLDALISLPQLQKLTLVHDGSASRPVHTIWGAKSLYYLGLAHHEIASSKSSLVLNFTSAKGS
ncbi:g434 [Coccomyxa elongata]